MKTGKYLLVVLMISASIFGIRDRVKAQSLDLSKTVKNVTTSSAGNLAKEGDILEYTIIVRNLTSVLLTGTTLIDNIPAGSSYVPASTTLNTGAVADASGNMPYTGSGSLVNSPLRPAGVLAPGASATIAFRVKVTANGGNITNYAMVETHNGPNTIYQNTNTVFTNLTADATCSVIYQSTASSQGGTPSSGNDYRYIRTLSTVNGTAGPLLYNGATGLSKNALTGALLSAGSVLKYASAIAYDKKSNRIYFVNNYSNSKQDLCYINLNESVKTAYRYVGYTMETTLEDGWNINRMAFASDGFGYAITQNGQDIIKFSVNPSTNIPTITRMGALINDPSNASSGMDILDESGGDIFGDGSGNLYLIANSSNLYKINPNTKNAIFLGSVNPNPASSSNAIAVDASGTVYIGGAYQNVYTVNLLTMAASSITSGTSNVWTTGDYTSCAFPVLAPALTANKTYRNINGSNIVFGGDTVEYKIEVINTGNINAAGVKLHDAIPSSTVYIPGSTYLNGVPVADDAGEMPFSIPGGREIHSPNEYPGIIRPGVASKAVLTFRAKVQPMVTICNQSRITLLDVNGNTIFINSNDPTIPGTGNPTCFFSDGTLPLKSLELKGIMQNDQSLLQWEVREEQDISHYEVLYAADGINFKTIGKVNSKGNSLSTQTYKYTDAQNTQAVNRYYRIRAVGVRPEDQTLSKIIRLSMNNLQDIHVQPNPFQKDITVRMELRNPEQVRFRLVDLSGKELLNQAKQLARGSHSITLNIGANLSQGVYVLEIYTASDNQAIRQKLVKR
ncbi:DUF11 domain-containing protein [Pseudoflavitalea sp. G-6-1-2]|uniref:T9SS type A sorting domain-containing protein n=1 Tax=Pseudoflavitalea sp. G-6-1-2 TaxID=2728841 RepID=UPI00146F779F|nr:T9SS type A sorting domain-containing protein [Pseudoflavitalea sp. G-6-1-2]NML20499.1 DUF11 domain-containing protein [Pseudoflavitalea sp. G-6-1-2]